MLSADSLENQLKTFEQVINWLDTSQPKTILMPLYTLNTIVAFLKTNLFVKRNVNIEITSTGQTRSLTIQPILFVEPILHVLDNAIDSIHADGKGGSIYVNVTFSDSHCTVDIENTGAPIPDDFRDTSPFNPGIGTSELGPGMGLAFSTWLIKNAGGEISFLHEQVDRVCIRLTFPLKVS